MFNKKALCDKIKEIYPEIGECGIDVDVEQELKDYRDGFPSRYVVKPGAIAERRTIPMSHGRKRSGRSRVLRFR